MKNLTEEFFRVFGIEPEINYVCDKRPCKKGLLKTCADIGCSHLYDTREDYPEITDRILLELICILNSICGINCTAYEAKNIEDLKEEILVECLSLQDEQNLHYEIQKLFKENE